MMYGVSEDLPFASFVGEECQRICLGQFHLQFYFSGENKGIGVERKWELKDDNGEMIDQSMPHHERTHYRVHGIFSQPVSGFEVNVPLSFTLKFANGYTLTIYDDSDLYESFSIHADGRACYI